MGYEIGRAVEWGKPVLCLYRPTASRQLSGMIAGCSGAIVQDYDSLEDLAPYLVRYFR